MADKRLGVRPYKDVALQDDDDEEADDEADEDEQEEVDVKR